MPGVHDGVHVPFERRRAVAEGRVGERGEGGQLLLEACLLLRNGGGVARDGEVVPAQERVLARGVEVLRRAVVGRGAVEIECGERA